MLTQEQKQLIRDLESYDYLNFKLADMTESYARTLNHLNDLIARIDNELNEYHVPSIKYDTISIKTISLSKSTRVIELITEQDILLERIEKIKEIQKIEVDKVVSRLEDVDSMLSKLTRWEKDYIEYMYIKHRGIDFMMDNYRFKSRSSVYSNATRLLNKMLKK